MLNLRNKKFHLLILGLLCAILSYGQNKVRLKPSAPIQKELEEYMASYDTVPAIHLAVFDPMGDKIYYHIKGFDQRNQMVDSLLLLSNKYFQVDSVEINVVTWFDYMIYFGQMCIDCPRAIIDRTMFGTNKYLLVTKYPGGLRAEVIKELSGWVDE